MPIAELISEYQTLVAQVADLENQTASLGNQVIGLKDDLASDERHIAELQDELLRMGAQVTALQAQPAALNGLTDIHLHGDWKLGVGPTIAPMDPSLIAGTDYGFRQFQSKGGSSTAMELYFNKAVAGKYSGFLASLVRRPIEKPVANLFFKGRIFHDDHATSGMQAVEFDTMLHKDLLRANQSSQINYAAGGMLQVVNDASGTKGWKDTDIVVGKLAPNVWHDFLWEYWYDLGAKVFGYTAFTLDGTRYPIVKGEFMQEAETPMTWPGEGLHTQLQIGTNSKGLPFSVCWDNLDYLAGGRA